MPRPAAMDKLTIEELETKRNSFNRLVANLENYVTESQDSDVTSSTIVNLSNRLERLKVKFNEFETIQDRLELLVENKDLEFDNREKIETDFFKVSSEVESLIQSYKVNNALESKVTTKVNQQQPVKLPTIDLPTFHGDFAKWCAFQDTFNALINSNDSLSDVQKLCYLKSALKGDAANVIQCLETTSDNYTIAFNLLKERFNYKRKIIYSHVNELLNLKFVTIQSFINSIEQNLQCLRSLNIETEKWDAIIVPLIMSKLDSKPLRDWEAYISSNYTKDAIPTYKDFIKFLLERADTFDSTKRPSQSLKSNKLNSKVFTAANKTIENICTLCKANHLLFACKEFLNKTINDRIKFVKDAKLCRNCLRKGHFHNNCKSSNCKHCNLNHNSLLHFNSESNTQIKSQETNENNSTVSNCTTQIALYSQTLLPTAQVLIQDKFGKLHLARALLDSASQSNFISQNLYNILQTEKHTSSIRISGITQSHSKVSDCTRAKFHSKCKKYSVELSFLILDKITEELPQITFDRSSISLPTNIELSDDSFNISSPIDILLGADVFWQIIQTGQIQITSSKLYLQNSKLGWIVTGQVPYHNNPRTSLSYTTLETQIERFWQVDDFKDNINAKYTREELRCQDLFKETTVRDPSSGKFVVQVPFKETVNLLGNSKNNAITRFFALENKLKRNAETKTMYVEFMREYERLGHMSKSKDASELGYYLPHHPVIREDKLTTKLRVVFDGSSVSDTGYSLNDVQSIGPSLQTDIFSIILNFRKHKFVATADIEKMYRQILLYKPHRRFHKIFWREEPGDKLEIYELNTVTYGTASAPYLSIRCLHQLADEFADKYPSESSTIKTDFYVDDLITGSDDITELNNRCSNITQMLDTAGFKLRKWMSNTPLFVLSNKDASSQDVNLTKHDTKMLGISYNPSHDVFQYTFLDKSQHKQYTKRTILSDTAQIFDPLGLLSPVTIVPKIIIQSLWSLKLDWDDNIPSELHKQWHRFKDDLKVVQTICIPRHVLNTERQSVELHGFCDASERAYAACVYIRSYNSKSQSVTVHLVAARSRVAPLKNLSIPRLELCAATLLAELSNRVCDIFKINFTTKTLWSDSKIVLAWINSPPSRWKTFVANRVAEIQRLTNQNSWYYINTKENPADLSSRGVTACELKESYLWWHGPIWLSEPEYTAQNEINFEINNLPEQKSQEVTVSATVTNNILLKYSNLNTLINVTAYCLRFANNCRDSIKNHGHLTGNERKLALNSLIKLAQQEVYQNEIYLLSNNHNISKSNILSLAPFLDNFGILRVGGRLNNSIFNYDIKHQIILPPKHPLTRLIIQQKHIENLHCGQQQLLHIVRQHYWPISGKSFIKQIIHNCIKCAKLKPKTYIQQMGNLPQQRLTPSPPFYYCGVDFAGPFLTRDRRARGYKTFKCYICLFICFNTKAVHLELVSDLTTEAFLASLRRFIARRGQPSTIFSDNGTNFVGANSELTKLQSFIHKNVDQIARSFMGEDGPINWEFIPPNAPHFGGLWEIHIKLVKNHFKRVIGERILTFEEFYTFLTQVEAVINSRPISPLSSDPSDLNPLTPGHFLIGRPLNTAPDDNYMSTPENRLSAFQRMQKLVQHFWQRWHLEYIHTLQTRSKWKKASEITPKVNDLVLIKDNNSPPARWKMGRVLELHPGKDGLTRVVTVRSSSGNFKRAITKLCPLSFFN